ncbi:MAG: hypothetical protein ACI8RZ_003659 [Myxococcota bacterium]|jgi:hypothetical protein
MPETKPPPITDQLTSWAQQVNEASPIKPDDTPPPKPEETTGRKKKQRRGPKAR